MSLFFFRERYIVYYRNILKEENDYDFIYTISNYCSYIFGNPCDHRYCRRSIGHSNIWRRDTVRSIDCLNRQSPI